MWLLLLVGLSSCALGVHVAEDPAFTAWAATHRTAAGGHRYRSPAERLAREEIFVSNIRRIENVNAAERAKSGPLRLEANAWADMTFEEWKARETGFAAGTDACAGQLAGGDRHPELQAALDAGLPSEVDWRDPAKNPAKINAVTPAKNQGGCGSCWAFSTTGSMEGAHAIKTGKLVSLSEQQLVDCDQPPGGMASKCCSVADPKGCDCGCKGGIMSRGFQYLQRVGGLASEAAYSYTGSDGACKAGFKPVATISGQVNLSMGDLDGLTAAVSTKGPVSVAIDVNFCWQFYQNGSVFYGNTTGADGKDYCSDSGEPCSSKPADLDHGVLVVGYGSHTPPGGKPWDVWYVKNSWGPGYGDRGFMLFAKGATSGGRSIYDKGNLCGIASCATYSLA